MLYDDMMTWWLCFKTDGSFGSLANFKNSEISDMKPSTVISSVNTRSLLLGMFSFKFWCKFLYLFPLYVRDFFNVRFVAHCQFEHHDSGFVRDDNIGTRCFVEYFIYWTECRRRRIHVQCLIFGDVGSYPVCYYFQDGVVSSGISCQSCGWWAVRKSVKICLRLITIVIVIILIIILTI